MKKIIFLFLFSFSLFAQQPTLSKYERADVNYEGQQYAKLLNIDNKNQLILKIRQQEFIVFKDSTVYRFYIDWDKSINKKKLSASETLLCLNHLETLKSINPYNLNVTKQVKTDSLDAIEYIDVQDGISYKLCLFKNNVTVSYETYSPEIYIEQKFPFYKEREKLSTVYKYFNSLFEEVKATKNCGLMNEILSNQEVSKYLPVRSKKIARLYLVKNNLCCSGFKVNQHYNLMLINEDQIKKRMDYFKITSIKEQFGVKVILLSYPKKNIVFNVFVKDDKVVDIKVENKKSDEK